MDLYEACLLENDNKVFQILESNCVEINFRHRLCGHTALMAAAINEKKYIVGALLCVKGIDIDAKTHAGFTAWDLTNSNDIKDLIKNKKEKL